MVAAINFYRNRRSKCLFFYFSSRFIYTSTACTHRAMFVWFDVDAECVLPYRDSNWFRAQHRRHSLANSTHWRRIDWQTLSGRDVSRAWQSKNCNNNNKNPINPCMTIYEYIYPIRVYIYNVGSGALWWICFSGVPGEQRHMHHIHIIARCSSVATLCLVSGGSRFWQNCRCCCCCCEMQ